MVTIIQFKIEPMSLMTEDNRLIGQYLGSFPVSHYPINYKKVIWMSIGKEKVCEPMPIPVNMRVFGCPGLKQVYENKLIFSILIY